MKRYYFKNIFLTLAIAILLFMGFQFVNALDYPLISATPLSVKVGQLITITINTYINSIEKYILSVYYHGVWHDDSSAINAGSFRQWTLSEDSPGNYIYSGRYKLKYKWTDVWQSGWYSAVPVEGVLALGTKPTVNVCQDECIATDDASNPSICVGNYASWCGNNDSDICWEWPTTPPPGPAYYDCGLNAYCDTSVKGCRNCAWPQENCDNNPSNACETNVLTDNNNCGSCGSVCSSGCQNGSCPAPTVDIKSGLYDGPISVLYNSPYSRIMWASTNATSCLASGDWSGSKALSGTEAVGVPTFTSSKTYTLACTGAGGSASDSIAFNVCNNECSSSGATQCSGSSVQTCGNYDSDSCLEWSSLSSCPSGQTCQNGVCTTISTCTNECSTNGLTQCSGNSIQSCGNYDTDTCLEWSSLQSCASNQTCQGGQCVNITPPTCQNEDGCVSQGLNRCYGNAVQTCGNYETSDTCLEWSPANSCGSNQFCQNGACISNVPGCSNQCPYSGATLCYDVKTKRICGDYNSDNCLEWGSSQTCTGNTSCGSEGCPNTQRPVWKCETGNCGRDCVNDTSCGAVLPTPSCTDEGGCSESKRWQYECTDNTRRKQCGKNWDNDSCFEWGPVGSCIGNTTCGHGTCEDNQRPQWYCSQGSCLYNCQDDSTCQISGYVKNQRKDCYQDNLYWFDSNNKVQEIDKDCLDGCDDENNMCVEDWIGSTKYCETTEQHCGDGILNCEEDAYTCAQDAGPSEIVLSAFVKKSDSEDWQETLNAKPGESLDILLLVINNSSDDLDDPEVQADLPPELIYKQDLKIKDISYFGDIRDNLKIGFTPSNTEKRITFKVEIAPNTPKDTELEIPASIELQEFTYSDSVKLIVEEASKESKPSFFKWLISKWYIWLLLWILFIILIYWFIRRSKQGEEEF